MMMMNFDERGEENEFYVTFSSNDCLMIHPNNQANEFRTSWETPKELSGRWKVALTEVQYNNFHCIANSAFGVKYGRQVPVIVKFAGKVAFVDNMPTLDIEFPPSSFATVNIPLPTVRKTGDDKVMFKSRKCKNFTVTFDTIEEANKFGFTALTNATTNGELISSNRLPAAPPPIMVPVPMSPPDRPSSSANVTFKYTFPPRTALYREQFDKDLVAPSTDAPITFCNTLLEKFGKVFKNVTYDEATKCFHITMNNDIIHVEFLGGLNLALGFTTVNHVFGVVGLKKRTISSDVNPCLFNGISKLRFLTNIVEPSMIGGGHECLLKSVFIDSSDHEFGKTVTQSFQTPMYRSVAITSINTIEITVKSENSNDVAPFIDGSQTTVTLHFKKNDN